MSSPDHRFSKPAVVLAKILVIICCAEIFVMFLLPFLLPPQTSELFANLADGLLLTLLTGPFVWHFVARPLRTVAMNEFNRSTAALDNVVDAVVSFDRCGNVEALNGAAERLFGHAPAEMVGQPVWLLIPDLNLSLQNQFYDWSTGHTRESSGRHKSGYHIPVEMTLTAQQRDHEGFTIVIHDLTERRRAEMVLAEQKAFAENLVQNSAVPIFVLSPEHRVLIWNRACEELTGLPAEAMLGKAEPWRAFYDKPRPVLADIVIEGTLDEAGQHYDIFARSAFIPEGLQAEGWYPNLNGCSRYIMFNAAPIRNAAGELLAVIESLEDMTERKRYEEQLEFQANHDGLTALPNKNLLNDRIRQALLLTRRNLHEVAIFCIDLDNFKLINDTLGHDVGDILLTVVAERLGACIRSGDTVARQGGDEFIVVVAEQAVADHAQLIAGKILEAIVEPIRINQHELIVTCSIGISIFPRDGEDVQTLIKHADIAMYRAKEQGRNTFQFFTGQMNVRSLTRMTMTNHLRRALEHEELSVFYQPKVSLRSGRITGMEALVRWHNPEMGTVSPVTFIPLAEETGLIEPIGEWVLKTACAQNQTWQTAGLPPLTLAVNLSPRQFRQQDVSHLIGQVLLQTGLNPRYLELEITESMVMQDADRVTTVLNELKQMGTSLAMDDFGTGYSSLSYLKRFPFDKLKIDQSFVRDITSDPDNAAIARAIIAMAHSLRLKVIAEGVETEGQMNYLRSNDCDEMQGYFFSHPLPAVDFERLLRDDRHLNISSGVAGESEKSILVVDDEPEVAMALSRMLVLEGYRVLVASSAAAGFELLANNAVALIISDQRMPVMTGTEFLSRVKELYPEIVRIILTGYADLNSITDAVNRGAIYKFLNKPWSDQLMRDTVQEALKYHASLSWKIDEGGNTVETARTERFA